MTDIFISYAREDKERVRPIVEELEKRGWSVFWDRKIPPGHKWESSIGIALEKSRCVLAVWSEESINSDWVKDEATVAKKRGVLVPVVFDAVDQPMGFRQIQAADLSDWKNNSSHQAFQDLIGAIESKMSSADQPVIAPTPTPGPDPEPKPAPAKTLHYRSPNLKAVTQPALVVERGWFSKIKPKQAAIAVAVVLVVILLFVGLIGRKQEEIPAEQAPTALSTPAPLDAEAVKAKQEAAARKKQADEAAKVKAVVRQKAAELKARQKADSLRQVREAKLREKNEAAQLKARQETDARKQQAEEAA
ncbi:MAG: TIR domain-containing protein, partial [Chlorobium sp.]